MSELQVDNIITESSCVVKEYCSDMQILPGLEKSASCPSYSPWWLYENTASMQNTVLQSEK